MNTLTSDEVHQVVATQRARYAGEDLARAVRTELHAALQLKNPPPYSSLPSHIVPGQVLTEAQRLQVHDHQRAQVTEAEHVAFSRARAKQPHVLDGHHYVQMQHGTALWEEVDRVLATLGGLR